MSGREGRAWRLMHQVGAGCSAHRRRVIAAWLALTAALVGCVLVYGRPTDSDLSLPGSDAQLARDLLDGSASGSTSSGTIIVTTEDGRLDEPGIAAALSAAGAGVRQVAHVTEVRPPSAASGSVSADGRTGYFTVTLDLPRREVTAAAAQEVLDAAGPAVGAGLQVLPGGVLADAVDRSGGHRHELIGLVVAAVVLTVTLGSLPGSLVALLTSIVALVAAICTIGLAGHLATIPGAATTLASMVGLGVGIDYALFLLTRHRDLVASGVPVPLAVARSVADSGTAVVFAGATVIVALGGLAVADVPILTTLAWTCGVAVLFAVAAAVTLLPALISAAGSRTARGRPGGDPDVGRGWARQADRVTRRPWLSAGLAVALLAALALPAADLRLGQLDDGDHPTGTAARRAADAMTAAFGAGSSAPLTVVTRWDSPVPASDARRAELGRTLTAIPGVASVGAVRSSGEDTVLSVQVTPTTTGGDPATADLVRRLRDLRIPDATVHVGGVTATKADLASRIGQRMPWVIGTVLLLSIVVLLVAFRAPVVVLKAALMDLISIGAAYGALTAVFVHGWGAEAIGLSGPVPIESYVPLMLFALLFGLSMDYEVFLLTAVRRAWKDTGDNRVAVRRGLAATGGVITAAAIIMVSVFAGFVPDDDPAIKMFGVGMAVAVAVDATIVRGLLAPATMALMGPATWWTPRLPRRFGGRRTGAILPDGGVDTSG